MKVKPTDKEKTIQLLRGPNQLPPKELPDAVPPPRLSAARVAYLYKHIHESCTASTQDIVCPAPEQTADEGDSSSSEQLHDMSRDLHLTKVNVEKAKKKTEEK